MPDVLLAPYLPLPLKGQNGVHEVLVSRGVWSSGCGPYERIGVDMRGIRLGHGERARTDRPAARSPEAACLAGVGAISSTGVERKMRIGAT